MSKSVSREYHKNCLELERNKAKIAAHKAEQRGFARGIAQATYHATYGPHEERLAAEEGVQLDKFRETTIKQLYDGFGVSDDDGAAAPIADDEVTESVKALRAKMGGANAS